MSERLTEIIAESMMDQLDRKLLTGRISQEQYDREVSTLEKRARKAATNHRTNQRTNKGHLWE